MTANAAGHVSQSTRNIINITTSQLPPVNISAHEEEAGSTPTSFSTGEALTSSNGNSSLHQQRLPQLPSGTTSAPRQLPTIPSHTERTTATIIMNSKRPTIIIYPTVSPESIVIPIVSCILGFPLLALLVICCLRRRAKLARERGRRRNYDMQDHAVSLITDRRELSVCVLSEA